MDMDAFFKVHSDLPREGPGCDGDVAWAFGQVDLPKDAAICDAGSGPGGDIAALLVHAPQGRVLAIDTHAPFAETVAQRFAGDARVTARAGDMAELAGMPEAPFDLIWCAGALYFLDTQSGLEGFRAALKPGGIVAFSAPCWFVDTPSDEAAAFWRGYDGVRSRDEIAKAADAAGYQVLAQRPVTDTAWENYYTPMETRIAALRPGADPALEKALDEAAWEAAQWRKLRFETGYQLMVVRKT